MKIKCIVIDDEYLAQVLLNNYIKRLHHLELIASCSNAIEAMEVLQTESVDLMFLDVQMPELTGIDFLKTLKNQPAVVFTTAYSRYAIDGYSLNVIDYLLKPISFERFIQAVNKSIEQIKLVKNQTFQENNEFINIKAEYRIHKVLLKNILYLEGMKEYVIIYLKEGKRIITLDRMKNFEEKLPNSFMRIHRSYIVSKSNVKSLYGNMIEIGEEKISIGKTYKEQVIKELFE